MTTHRKAGSAKTEKANGAFRRSKRKPNVSNELPTTTNAVSTRPKFLAEDHVGRGDRPLRSENSVRSPKLPDPHGSSFTETDGYLIHFRFSLPLPKRGKYSQGPSEGLISTKGKAVARPRKRSQGMATDQSNRGERSPSSGMSSQEGREDQ